MALAFETQTDVRKFEEIVWHPYAAPIGKTSEDLHAVVQFSNGLGLSLILSDHARTGIYSIVNDKEQTMELAFLGKDGHLLNHDPRTGDEWDGVLGYIDVDEVQKVMDEVRGISAVTAEVKSEEAAKERRLREKRAERKRAVVDKLSEGRDDRQMAYSVVEAAFRYFDYSEGGIDDFCLQHGSLWHVVIFGGTNRLYWSIERGFSMSEEHCTDRFKENFEKVRKEGW